MDEDYDVIALGTGLKECILSGLLSVSKRKVLHMDRNNYYGGESASLNLEQLWQRFRPEEKVPEGFGRSRDYNVDLCPKFIMAGGNLVKMLIHTKVTRYLEFRSVAGSYVVAENKIHKVPATPTEAASSGLMGFFQKGRFKSFLTYVANLEQGNPKTWEGKDASKETAEDIFKYWKLDDQPVVFTGHAIALHQNDDYLKLPALPTLEKIQLYANSIARYGNSPYIYPMYGLGGLPEGFSRLSAVYGGVYMLNRPIEEVLYDETGHVSGVKSQGEVARCKQLLADPSYFIGTDKIKKVGQVARCICILSHPVDNTNNADSCQIIVPFHQIPGRKHDIYVSVVSFVHQVAAQNKWIAVVSSVVESNNPHDELIPALKFLGKIDREFFWVTDRYVANNDPKKDGIYITSSYDSTTHFEDATVEVMNIFQAMTGEPVNLDSPADLDAANE